MFQLQTKRLVLKRIPIKDCNQMFIYMNDIETTKFLYNGNHKDISETIDFIGSSYIKNNIDLLGIYLKDTDILIGHIAMLFAPLNDLLWVQNKKYQGNGYLLEAGEVFIKYIFNRYNWDYIEAHADINNIKSIKLMENLKMTRCSISERIYPDDRKQSMEVDYQIRNL